MSLPSLRQRESCDRIPVAARNCVVLDSRASQTCQLERLAGFRISSCNGSLASIVRAIFL